MSGHTPGPWTCGNGTQYEPSTNVYCDDSLGSIVATCGHSHNVLVTREQEQANARLIAAAPELLAALIYARQQLQYYADADGEDYNSPSINAAIAKATGGQP